jgi:hypothetical protein
MSTLTKHSQTEEIIASMMVENTGASILDSGGTYGRHWQENQGLDVDYWTNSPRVTVEDRWGDVTLSTFHHLVEQLDYASQMDAMYQAFSKDNQNSHLEDIEEFIESIGAIKRFSDNSYNRESNLSQVIQYTVFSTSNNLYVALQVHGGADVRGGYTRPRIFTMSDGEEYGLTLEGITINCDVNREHYLDTNGSGEWTDHLGNYRQTPYSLHEVAEDRGTEGIACPDPDCKGHLTA